MRLFLAINCILAAAALVVAAFVGVDPSGFWWTVVLLGAAQGWLASAGFYLGEYRG